MFSVLIDFSLPAQLIDNFSTAATDCTRLAGLLIFGHRFLTLREEICGLPARRKKRG
ncbi:hypothetical protein [Undibacterium umbellatum]|uniref:Uncharacterized protein n=1 Tax=Undibacterium umbellatum TaxID=2762300 RepID=A0ABR6Z8T6_9BURK|nr:hypothetical protein [Undibacterium umbellatum]MBC3908024.1 hypothetical protein [Undibacterium umbellatum]